MIETLLDVDAVVAHSFKDFHAKGVDYLCLKRSPSLTLKVYLFDGDASKAPEVVYPHDHRYDFDTAVIAGAVENVMYWTPPAHWRSGQVLNEYAYRTPLNGGGGFRFRGEIRIAEDDRLRYDAGSSYSQFWHQIHTIRIAENRTVLFLRQHEDTRAMDEPSRTFSRGDAPSLDGLYSKFTADEVIARLRRIERPLLAWALNGGGLGGVS